MVYHTNKIQQKKNAIVTIYLYVLFDIAFVLLCNVHALKMNRIEIGNCYYCICDDMLITIMIVSMRR